MRATVIGGGPAGLYFALLARKAFPDWEIVVHERNRPDDTFGWGVVFSEETLTVFGEADPESYERIRASFAYWDDIDTWVRGERVRSSGHGFCGLSRVRLLQILHERCREVGVELVFRSEVTDDAELAGADLVLAADGANSAIRAKYEDVFRPTIEWGRCKFTWLGTTRPLESFTFVFRETEHGLFQVHAYPFQRGEEPLSTWIVECHEDVWRRAGLDRAGEEETATYFQELFADHLEGHPLLTNRSIWRTFPTITCEAWHHGRICLIGDAAHTAHFSIGSGTKLAMEDAIALVDAFRTHGAGDVPRALAAYQEARHVDVLKLQRAAATSREWFESSARYTIQTPLQFTFNLLTRSKRITYDNLAVRDPELVRRVTDWFGESTATQPASDGVMPPPLFAPLAIRGLVLGNRVVVSPMCQYSAVEGVVGDWHLVHLGSRAIGGAGLVFTEMTDVTPEGRITHGCAGIWNDEQERAWKRVVDFVHENSGAAIGIQIAHAGRKGSCEVPWEGGRPLRDERAWETLAPSALPFGPGWPAPREMSRADMERVRDAFAAAAGRAARAGFDVLEVHMAHGYLLSSFLSPLTNRRRDEWGGSLEGRARFPLEVLDAVRAVWPPDAPLFARVSATDWLDREGGQTIDDSVRLARMLVEHGCDVVDVSTAGNVPESAPRYGRMYQVPFAERIRHEAGALVMAVGGIQGADHVNTVLAAGRADLCALARPHLVNPYVTLGAAARYRVLGRPWPKQYLPAAPRA